MTAYGRSTLNSPLGHFVFEIQSVNRKFLDVSVMIPKELSQFEIEIKKWLLEHVGRGHITIKICANFEESSPLIVKPNLLLARQLKNGWMEIAQEVGLPNTEFSLSLLSTVPGILKYEENTEDEDFYRQILKSLFDEAVENFTTMKVEEGEALKKEILERIRKIYQLILLIEKKAPNATIKYRDKLIMRLSELPTLQAENEERVLKEIALFAEKIDIAEEITRFNYHIKHFEELIQSPTVSIGKTLEFVLQELNREVNTIGSKSADIEIARSVIDIKSELEKIKEQIQNVE